MKVCVAGQGAFGQKHLAGLSRIDGVEVVSLAGGSPETTEAVAKKFGIPHWTTKCMLTKLSNVCVQASM